MKLYVVSWIMENCTLFYGGSMIKVSIIIPVHNTSMYLDRCFGSCLSQTLDEIEIIAVDDLSTDNSADIIRQYAETYPDKFRGIYLPENIRQGGARNVGIREAKGEYLLFLDSDDFIKPDMCRALYENAKGADLSGGDCCIFEEDGQEKNKPLAYTADDVGVMNEEKLLKYMFSCGLFWTRIYRRDFLVKNDIFFPEKLFFEDAWFNFMTGLYAETIHKTDGFFYCYYQSPNSTTRNKKDKRKFERLPITDRIFDDCKARGLYEKHKDAVEAKFLGMSASNILYTCFANYDPEEIGKLYNIRESVKKRVPDYKKTFWYAKAGGEEKYYFDLTMISPRVSAFVFTHQSNIFIRVFRKVLFLIKYGK